MTDRTLRISFDLDDTLICHHPDIPLEPNKVPFFLRPWFTERLRLGTCSLMRKLRKDGWEIWIYTTSYRSPRRVKWWLRLYGIKVASVVNQQLHEQQMTRSLLQRHISKYPPGFGINLHVDDSEGVKLEGTELGFEVVVVNPHDQEWARHIMEAAAKIVANRMDSRLRGNDNQQV